jgi:hypothetical protein
VLVNRLADPLSPRITPDSLCTIKACRNVPILKQLAGYIGLTLWNGSSKMTSKYL